MNNEYSTKEIKDELDAIKLRLDALLSHIGGGGIDGTHPDSILGRLARIETIVAASLTKEELSVGWRSVEHDDYSPAHIAWRDERMQRAKSITWRVATDFLRTFETSREAFKQDKDI